MQSTCYLTVVWICIFLIRDTEHTAIYPVVIFMSSLEMSTQLPFSHLIEYLFIWYCIVWVSIFWIFNLTWCLSSQIFLPNPLILILLLLLWRSVSLMNSISVCLLWLFMVLMSYIKTQHYEQNLGAFPLCFLLEVLWFRF